MLQGIQIAAVNSVQAHFTVQQCRQKTAAAVVSSGWLVPGELCLAPSEGALVDTHMAGAAPTSDSTCTV